jgi:hypothetical protein
MSKSHRVRIARKVIGILGGPSAVSKLVGAPVSTVQSWELKGIPDWRIAVVEAAAAAEKKDIPELPRKERIRRAA